MLTRFFHVSHNTQMLGIKYAYLMIKNNNQFYKIDCEEKIDEKSFRKRKKQYKFRMRNRSTRNLKNNLKKKRKKNLSFW